MRPVFLEYSTMILKSSDSFQELKVDGVISSPGESPCKAVLKFFVKISIDT
jgi:hypothetical protein